MIEYKCTQCGATGCKLWREYSVFALHTRLLCAACACADQHVPNRIDPSGRQPDKHGVMTDQIRELVPAVPTEDGESFWGYTSVPQNAVEWWRNLPLKG